MLLHNIHNSSLKNKGAKIKKTKNGINNFNRNKITFQEMKIKKLNSY